ncbi:hypothetical protein DL93DRAFT_2164530 [Clavulina sp. PMI_390]|nr:hypothetical protein DL93DRAFT_2164530 [Clavulina sp. PMI_390]
MTHHPRLLDPFVPGTGSQPTEEQPKIPSPTTSPQSRRESTKIRTRATTNLKHPTSTVRASVLPSLRPPGTLSSYTGAPSAILTSSVRKPASIETSNTSIAPPQTYLGTRIYSEPTPPASYTPAEASPSHPPIVSVALVCCGVVIIVFGVCIVLRRWCCLDSEEYGYQDNAKESPIFGGGSTPYDEKFTIMGSMDSWGSIQADLTKGMGLASLPVESRSQLHGQISPTHPNQGFNSSTMVGNSPSSAYQLNPGSASSNREIKPSYTYSQAFGTHNSSNSAGILSSSPVSSLDSRTPKPDQNTIPPSKISSKGTKGSTVAPNVLPLTRPLALRHPKHAVTTRAISRPVLQSTTNLAVQAMVAPVAPKSILKNRPPAATNISYASQTQYKPTPRPLNPPTVIGPSESTSSVTNFSSSTECVRGLSRGLDFPLPPTTLASIPASASTVPAKQRRYSMVSVASRKSGVFQGSASGALANVGDLMMQGFVDSDMSGDETTDVDDAFVTVTATRVPVPSSDRPATSVNQPNLQILPPPSLPASSIPSVPSIMVTATSENSLKTLNRRLSRNLTRAVDTRHGPLAPWKSIHRTSVERITPSASSRFDDSDSDLDDGHPRAVPARAATQASQRHRRDSRSTSCADIMVPTNGWPALAQMAMERAQPEYRSATYSIYNMYQDDPSSCNPPVPSLPPSHSSSSDIAISARDYEYVHTTPYSRGAKTPQLTTMSTIYSGYGLNAKGTSNGDGEDIGTTFVREVGDSFEKIGVI